jgi:hypothetical protein
VKDVSARCGTKSHPAKLKRYVFKLFQAVARINPLDFRTLKQAPCQDLRFAHKSIYTEINTGILIRGFDPSLQEQQDNIVFARDMMEGNRL